MNKLQTINWTVTGIKYNLGTQIIRKIEANIYIENLTKLFSAE